MAAQRDVVLDRLRILEKRGGKLTAETVVADAADPDSPLHDVFEWDDAVAANRHRVEQARALIRRYRFEVTVEEVTLRVPQYVRDPARTEHQQGYVRTAVVAKDADRARAVLRWETERAVAHVVRVRSLAAFFGLEDECREIEESLLAVAELMAPT